MGLFAVFIVLGVISGQVQSVARRSGGFDPITRVTLAPVAPLGRVWAGAYDSVALRFSAILSAGIKKEELDKLRLQARSASIYTETVDNLRAELDAMKATIALPNYGKEKIAAYIYGVWPNENRIRIGVGSSRNVRKGCPVVTPEGLLGIVQTVSATESDVQLLTSPLPFKIGAMVEGPTPLPGLLHGEGNAKLILPLPSEKASSVKTGDNVSTSGFSEAIPRGIPIGKVVQVVNDKDNGEISLQVFPFAQLGKTWVVTVLR